MFVFFQIFNLYGIWKCMLIFFCYAPKFKQLVMQHIWGFPYMICGKSNNCSHSLTWNDLTGHNYFTEYVDILLSFATMRIYLTCIVICRSRKYQKSNLLVIGLEHKKYYKMSLLRLHHFNLYNFSFLFCALLQTDQSVHFFNVHK